MLPQAEPQPSTNSDDFGTRFHINIMALYGIHSARKFENLPFLPPLTDVSTTVGELMTKRSSILHRCPRYYHVRMYSLFQQHSSDLPSFGTCTHFLVSLMVNTLMQYFSHDKNIKILYMVYLNMYVCLSKNGNKKFHGFQTVKYKKMETTKWQQHLSHHFCSCIREVSQSPQRILNQTLTWMTQMHGQCLHPPSFYNGWLIA